MRAKSLVSGHLLRQRRPQLIGLLLLALVLQVSAGVGMSYVAGFSQVHTVLTHWSAPWLAVMVGAIVVSFIGYFWAYRGIYRVEQGPRLRRGQMIAVVAGGFGGFLAHGGSALDDYALRAAGTDKRDAKNRVSALAGMEHGVLGVIGTVAGIVVLAEGRAAPPADFSLPWAAIPIPGFALAFWLAERYRDRFHERPGLSGKVGVFLDSIHLNRLLFLRPRRHGPAVLGMMGYWLTDAFAMWAALEAFGYTMNAAALFIGYATGMVFTRRTGPLGGAGVLEVVLPVTIWVSGAPLPVAVVSVFVYRIVTLWLPMPFGLASLGTLREMGKPGTPGAEQPASSTEPALTHHRTDQVSSKN
jgi:uncharacterized membrane protein YbhN (UPF0104 family)